MFGVYRTLLATMVFSQHLAGIHVLGAYAVFGFYILSGYLMTSILQYNYGYSLIGFGKYVLNRFLRIYPVYWFSILLSILLVCILGENYTLTYNEAMVFPHTAYEWFRNIFIFFPAVEPPRLTPSSWALTVELSFYILIGLGLSRNKVLTIGWLVVSVAYHLVANVLNLGWDYIYFSIPAASLPFATGAAIFHYQDNLLCLVKSQSSVFRNALPVLLFFVILFNWWVGDVTGLVRSTCFYLNFILCTFMVLLLSNKLALSFISHKVDDWVGNLSYPIYVVHDQVGLSVMACMNQLGFAYHRPDLHILAFSFPLILLLAWLIMVGFEKPVERIRAKIRPAANLLQGKN